MTHQAKQAVNELDARITNLEAFINEKLRKDEWALIKSRDEIYQSTAEYHALETTIRSLMKSDEEIIKAKVDLGYNFFVQAVVPETKTICVAVGFGFFVEFTYPEALVFIENKIKELDTTAKKQSEQILKIRADVRFIFERLKELQGLQDSER